jgi:hypothetical protein
MSYVLVKGHWTPAIQCGTRGAEAPVCVRTEASHPRPVHPNPSGLQQGSGELVSGRLSRFRQQFGGGPVLDSAG